MKLKEEYINFFKEKGHVEIKSASIIPENDPTCLFTVAGMQPLIPYLLGEIHPEGKRLVNCQKCIRLIDLDCIGDSTHHTFFEMLGNWSLGDYFKKESISWSFEFLTKKLNIPLERLAVTVFKGNDMLPKDEEAYDLWHNLGLNNKRIAFLEKDNWWSLGDIGPCGSDTEIFYFRSNDKIPEVFDPNDDRWVEIWNNVFMAYFKDENGNFKPLTNKNIDTGMGLERTLAILENVSDNYLTSIWKDALTKLEELTNLSYNDISYQKSMRIILDHIRTSVIIIGDEALIKPSNTDQGYVLRRLIRRSIRHAKILNIDINSNWEEELANVFINQYGQYYKEILNNKTIIIDVLKAEKEKFNKTLEKGLKEYEKIKTGLKEKIINKDLAFKLYDTFGFPIELTKELATEDNLLIDIDGFYDKFKEHQEKSRIGSLQKFKGGLSDHSQMDIKYHTATHLLNAALKKVLDNDIHQKGSNITPDRLRFDFNHDRKLTDNEIKEVENLVNKYISMNLPVVKKEMTKEEALKLGAEAMFIDKYGDKVSVYFIGDISKELCGGPHVDNTKILGTFKIIKEEAVGSGIRRIKAILE